MRNYSSEKKAPPSPDTILKMSDQQIMGLVTEGKLQAHSLESSLGDLTRAISIRRQLLEKKLNKPAVLKEMPFTNYDWKLVHGACCENVIGYINIPVGIAGPLLMDDKLVHVPMATTEGALVASTHRGCKAITESGGVNTVITADGMTRAPVLRLPNVTKAAELKAWLAIPKNFYAIAAAFNSTSRFASLSEIQPALAGRHVYLRFKATTGDAMGMNMVSKGVEKALDVLQDYFPDLQVVSISGNYCTDKKPSAINWLQGRGKSVVAETIITKDIVSKVLKTSVPSLVELNIQKNLVGSVMAGSIGGNNAHSSNIVSAIYLATGQDPAQNVESSTCLTLMEATEAGDLRMSVTMPSIEVGTVGGGTHLPAQSASLELLGIRGASTVRPGAHSEHLARVVASTVLAGELSLMSALAAGHLVRSHMKMNRKSESPRVPLTSASYGDASSGQLLGPQPSDLLNSSEPGTSSPPESK